MEPSTAALAHARAFPLFNILQRYEGQEPWEAMDPIRDVLADLHLSEDVDLVIALGEFGIPLLAFSPKTAFGTAVCDDLLARGSTPPCPEGMCETGTNGECMWCGKAAVQ